MVESQVGPTLEDQLSFALYSASRAMTAHYRTGLEKHGLTYPQYLVMLVLWERTNITVTELTQRLQLSSGTVSPLLKRLEDGGLLTRNRREDDERVVQLTITDTGMDLLGQTAGERSAMRSATGMPADEIDELIAELTSLVTRVRAGTTPHAAGRWGKVSHSRGTRLWPRSSPPGG